MKKVRKNGACIFNIGGRLNNSFVASKKISRLVGTCMLILAICFIWYGFNNPQSSFKLSLNLVYGLYVVYIVLTIIFLIAPFKEKKDS